MSNDPVIAPDLGVACGALSRSVVLRRRNDQLDIRTKCAPDCRCTRRAAISTKASSDLKAAALRLIRERGYEKVSIATIAKEAGVARQTLYNRWNTKADLVLEAVFEETHNYAAEPVLDDAKDCRTKLEEFLINVFEHLKIDGDTLRALIASAQHDATFHASFYTNFVLPREKMLTALLHHAQERGEFPAKRNPEMVSSFIHGAFWYRLLNRGTLDANFAKDVTTEVFV